MFGKGKGGIHQRYRKYQKFQSKGARVYDEKVQEGPTTDDFMLDSALMFHTTKLWAWGHMPSTDVQRTAYNAYLDFKNVLGQFGIAESVMPCSIQTIARLGNWGQQPGNINRDLKRLLGKPNVPSAHIV